MIVEEILYEESDNGRVTMYYEPLIGHLITLTITKWSTEEYKRYLGIFNQILNSLKSRGIMSIAAITDSKKSQRLIELFGFSPTNQGLVCIDKVNRRIMRRTT